ncbi:uncharacterized protein MONOS_1981 [Monocercomonoides exilis]|uniref:uncharacterized protein n=1 Tax=Monocercomonoides exilis TaxID=2049356 RepID=UPI00355ACBFB|nr:hypothetical protein MONOS_1981 [Monocercomonoides exilis]|eukprot:MONOS_1981.1-p1 / transcript=MONOS_1981.1 / gene=MONOS_1981 / organism=Monocercomonoides_exilis_PA203 / gene_product=unspecified product / transcript_product=unspecified product / location=Mono_scaffold00038:52837-62627(+) / protein_length=3167 / sequence_SO=supercontig / SO=protein_coding / is_pseudo=false
MNGCEFRNCRSKGSGGCLYSEKGKLLLDNSIFKDSIAAIEGAGVYSRQGSGNVTGCRFIRCQLEKEEQGHLNFNYFSSFRRNDNEDPTGSACFFCNLDSLTITNSYLAEGWSKGYTAGICLKVPDNNTHPKVTLNLAYCLFASNVVDRTTGDTTPYGSDLFVNVSGTFANKTTNTYSLSQGTSHSLINNILSYFPNSSSSNEINVNSSAKLNVTGSLDNAVCLYSQSCRTFEAAAETNMKSIITIEAGEYSAGFHIFNNNLKEIKGAKQVNELAPSGCEEPSVVIYATKPKTKKKSAVNDPAPASFILLHELSISDISFVHQPDPDAENALFEINNYKEISEGDPAVAKFTRCWFKGASKESAAVVSSDSASSFTPLQSIHKSDLHFSNAAAAPVVAKAPVFMLTSGSLKMKNCVFCSISLTATSAIVRSFHQSSVSAVDVDIRATEFQNVISTFPNPSTAADASSSRSLSASFASKKEKSQSNDETKGMPCAGCICTDLGKSENLSSDVSDRLVLIGCNFDNCWNIQQKDGKGGAVYIALNGQKARFMIKDSTFTNCGVANEEPLQDDEGNTILSEGNYNGCGGGIYLKLAGSKDSYIFRNIKFDKDTVGAEKGAFIMIEYTKDELKPSYDRFPDMFTKEMFSNQGLEEYQNLFSKNKENSIEGIIEGAFNKSLTDYISATGEDNSTCGRSSGSPCKTVGEALSHISWCERTIYVNGEVDFNKSANLGWGDWTLTTEDQSGNNKATVKFVKTYPQDPQNPPASGSNAVLNRAEGGLFRNEPNHCSNLKHQQQKKQANEESEGMDMNYGESLDAFITSTGGIAKIRSITLFFSQSVTSPEPLYCCILKTAGEFEMDAVTVTGSTEAETFASLSSFFYSTEYLRAHQTATNDLFIPSYINVTSQTVKVTDCEFSKISQTVKNCSNAPFYYEISSLPRCAAGENGIPTPTQSNDKGGQFKMESCIFNSLTTVYGNGSAVNVLLRGRSSFSLKGCTFGSENEDGKLNATQGGAVYVKSILAKETGANSDSSERRRQFRNGKWTKASEVVNNGTTDVKPAISVEHCIFRNCYASSKNYLTSSNIINGCGGGMYLSVSEDATLSLNNISFTNCIATKNSLNRGYGYGGALFLELDTKAENVDFDTLKFENLLFSGTLADTNGNMIAFKGSDVPECLYHFQFCYLNDSNIEDIKTNDYAYEKSSSFASLDTHLQTERSYVSESGSDNNSTGSNKKCGLLPSSPCKTLEYALDKTNWMKLRLILSGKVVLDGGYKAVIPLSFEGKNDAKQSKPTDSIQFQTSQSLSGDTLIRSINTDETSSFFYTENDLKISNLNLEIPDIQDSVYNTLICAGGNSAFTLKTICVKNPMQSRLNEAAYSLSYTLFKAIASEVEISDLYANDLLISNGAAIDISSSDSITMQNLILTNIQQISDNGEKSPIYITQTGTRLSFSGKFTKMQSKYGKGGIAHIATSAERITIGSEDSIFGEANGGTQGNNSAEEEELGNGVSSLEGGAIYLESNSSNKPEISIYGTFSNCQVRQQQNGKENALQSQHKNTASMGKAFGGAIYLSTSYPATLNIKAKFSNCVCLGADSRGGAVYASLQNGSILSISNSQFLSCITTEYVGCSETSLTKQGAAIYIDLPDEAALSDVKISGSKFEHCLCTSSSSFPSSVTGSESNGCNVSSVGGCLGCVISGNGSFSCDSSNFTDCVAAGNAFSKGGAILLKFLFTLSTDRPSVKISKCIFNGKSDGSESHVPENSVREHRSTFVIDLKDVSQGFNALSTDDSSAFNISITDSEFKSVSITAKGDDDIAKGGAFCLSLPSSAVLEAKNCNFENCFTESPKSSGGAMHIEASESQSNQATTQLTLDNCTFKDCEARDGISAIHETKGGALFLSFNLSEAPVPKLWNLKFVGCNATKGTRIYIKTNKYEYDNWHGIFKKLFTQDNIDDQKENNYICFANDVKSDHDLLEILKVKKVYVSSGTSDDNEACGHDKNNPCKTIFGVSNNIIWYNQIIYLEIVNNYIEFGSGVDFEENDITITGDDKFGDSTSSVLTHSATSFFRSTTASLYSHHSLTSSDFHMNSQKRSSSPKASERKFDNAEDVQEQKVQLKFSIPTAQLSTSSFYAPYAHAATDENKPTAFVTSCGGILFDNVILEIPTTSLPVSYTSIVKQTAGTFKMNNVELYYIGEGSSFSSDISWTYSTQSEPNHSYSAFSLTVDNFEAEKFSVSNMKPINHPLFTINSSNLVKILNSKFENILCTTDPIKSGTALSPLFVWIAPEKEITLSNLTVYGCSSATGSSGGFMTLVLSNLSKFSLSSGNYSNCNADAGNKLGGVFFINCSKDKDIPSLEFNASTITFENNEANNGSNLMFECKELVKAIENSTINITAELSKGFVGTIDYEKFYPLKDLTFKEPIKNVEIGGNDKIDGQFCGTDYPCNTLHSAINRLDKTTSNNININDDTSITEGGCVIGNTTIKMAQNKKIIVGKSEVYNESMIKNNGDSKFNELAFQLESSINCDSFTTTTGGNFTVTKTTFNASTTIDYSLITMNGGGTLTLSNVKMSCAMAYPTSTATESRSLMDLSCNNVNVNGCSFSKSGSSFQSSNDASENTLNDEDAQNVKKTTQQLSFDSTINGPSSLPALSNDYSDTKWPDFCAWEKSCIYLHNSHMSATIANSTFSGQPQTALLVDGGNVTVKNCTFNNNKLSLNKIPDVIRKNIQCEGYTKLVLENLTFDGKQESKLTENASLWIRVFDPCEVVYEKMSSLFSLNFIPVVKSTSASIEKQSKKFTASFSGSNLVGCDVDVEIEEYFSKRKFRVPCLSEQGINTNSNSISCTVHMNDTSFNGTEIDDNQPLFQSLLFYDRLGDASTGRKEFHTDGRVSLGSGLINESRTSDDDLTKGEKMETWVIIVIIVAAVVVVIVVIVVIICAVSKNKSSRREEYYDDDEDEDSEEYIVEEKLRGGKRVKTAMPLNKKNKNAKGGKYAAMGNPLDIDEDEEYADLDEEMKEVIRQTTGKGKKGTKESNEKDAKQNGASAEESRSEKKKGKKNDKEREMVGMSTTEKDEGSSSSDSKKGKQSNVENSTGTVPDNNSDTNTTSTTSLRKKAKKVEEVYTLPPLTLPSPYGQPMKVVLPPKKDDLDTIEDQWKEQRQLTQIISMYVPEDLDDDMYNTF